MCPMDDMFLKTCGVEKNEWNRWVIGVQWVRNSSKGIVGGLKSSISWGLPKACKSGQIIIFLNEGKPTVLTFQIPVGFPVFRQDPIRIYQTFSLFECLDPKGGGFVWKTKSFCFHLSSEGNSPFVMIEHFDNMMLCLMKVPLYRLQQSNIQF